jgi:hypothetical protein
VRRLSLSRRAKGILAGVAFLFSVGAVSTKLLSGRVNDFCFCVPPVVQPAFTMPEATTAEAFHGSAVPGRVISSAGAPIDVTVINPAPAAFSTPAAAAIRDRDLSHLGVLWGSSHRFSHGSSSSSSHFSGGGAGGGGSMMGGGHSATAKKDVTNKPAAPKAARTAASPSHPSAPGAIIVPPAILPPTDTTGSTFGSNTDPIPGFGNGTGSTGAALGSLGGTLGGPGRVGGNALAVTPEPATLLLMLTGVLAALMMTRKRQGEFRE